MFCPLMILKESTSVRKNQERTMRESGSSGFSVEHDSAGDWPSFALESQLTSCNVFRQTASMEPEIDCKLQS
jgi:hypothetical protein